MISKNLIAAMLGLAFVASTPALAQKIGKHGGQTAIVAGHHDAELVIEAKRLVLYLTNYGKPLSAKDNAIKTTVQEGGKKTEVKLTVDKDHLVGSLAQPLPKGAIILLSGKTEDGHGVSARFTVR
jgi:hypothetical protein